MGSGRVLLCLWDGGGVVPPLLSVARALVDRGHRVVVLGDPTVEGEVETVGACFERWRTAPHRRSRDRAEDLLRDYAFDNPLAFMRRDLRAYHITPGPRWTSDALEAIDRHGIQLVLSDFALLWGLLAAEIRALPRACLCTFPYPLPTPGRRPSGADLLPVPSPLAPLRDAALRHLTERVYDLWLPVLHPLRQAHGLPAVRHALDLVRQASAVLVQTSPAFDPPGPPVPPHVRWVGPVLDDPSWCAPWRSPWPPDDPRPLVVVALSSTFQGQVELLRRLVEALAGLPVRGLVCLGPTVRQQEVPARGDVVVVPSAPHLQVLPLASALVTHAGHGTTLKGLAAGLPMVCLPMGRDQDDNAARVRALGAGLVLRPTAPVDALRRAVRRVLDEPGFRAAARALAGRIRRAEGQDDAVAVLEALLPPEARSA